MRIDEPRLESRITELAAIGGRGTAVSRLGLSPEERAAHDLVGSWLAARGGAVRRDAAANLFVRWGGDGPVILVGSHLDSVPNGGRFDGALGVACAVEAVESLLDAGIGFSRPVEVVGWADEEGVRFGIGLFGSCAAFGRLPPNAAERTDAVGVTIAHALRVLGERGDPTAARRDPGAVAAYLELHIEQGPHLADRGLELGVVSDIVGIYHARVTVRGRSDHAGATTMSVRRDALAGAAEMILAIERAARMHPDGVGTVGEIEVLPGAKNVVPGECTFSIDLRAPAHLDAMVSAVRVAIESVDATRELRSSIDVLSHVPAVPLDRQLRDLLLRTTAAVGISAPEMLSAAAHDAMNAQLAGVATGMIFVRSQGGSHNPGELATIADAVSGARALALALRELVE